MCPSIPNKTMFVGPTLHDVTRCTVDKLETVYTLASPARRGDIDELIRMQVPGEIVLVDGVFYDAPAIGHREIMNALQVGWIVRGLSSMGAIRAVEMGCYGMLGYGKVFKAFVENPAMRDDEVTLLHSEAPSYEPVSEQLIHLRLLLNNMSDTFVISVEQHAAVLCALEECWFGHRTLQTLSSLLFRNNAGHAGDMEKLQQEIGRFRVKSLDLEDFADEIA